MNKLVWLVRHAERADFNAKGEWDSTWPDRAKSIGEDPDDAPLTENGRKQAAHAASLIHGPLRKIYSSPFLRCRETAKIVADIHRTEWMTSTDLTEWMNPEWFRYTYPHLDRIHFQKYGAHFAPGYPKIPEETEASLIERWMRVYDGISALAADKFPMVLVSHGGGIHHMMNRYDPAIMSGKGVQFADVYRMEL